VNYVCRLRTRCAWIAPEFRGILATMQLQGASAKALQDRRFVGLALLPAWLLCRLIWKSLAMSLLTADCLVCLQGRRWSAKNVVIRRPIPRRYPPMRKTLSGLLRGRTPIAVVFVVASAFSTASGVSAEQPPAELTITALSCDSDVGADMPVSCSAVTNFAVETLTWSAPGGAPDSAIQSASDSFTTRYSFPGPALIGVKGCAASADQPQCVEATVVVQVRGPLLNDSIAGQDCVVTAPSRAIVTL
jgi:hypothetical protein